MPNADFLVFVLMLYVEELAVVCRCECN